MRATLPASISLDFIFVDKEDEDEVVWGGAREGQRLLRSDNEGVDWGGGLASESIGQRGLDAVATTADGDWVAYATYERFYLSSDQGQTWTPGNYAVAWNNLTEVNSFAIDQTTGRWITFNRPRSRLMVSDDQGENWEGGPYLPSFVSLQFGDVVQIAVDSTGTWILVAWRRLNDGSFKWTVFTRAAGATSLSHDSWTGPPTNVVDDAWDLPDTVSWVYGVACRDTQIEVLHSVRAGVDKIITSADDGTTWSDPVDLPENIISPSALAIDLSGSWLIADSTEPGKVWRSASGSSWYQERELPTDHLVGIASAADGNWIAVDDDSKRLYLSQNKGVVWDQGIKLPDELSDPADVSYAGDTLYLLDATDDAVYASHTNGVLWDLPRLPPSDTLLGMPLNEREIRGLAIDHNGIFYALDLGTRRIFLSEDEGRSWQYQSILPAEATTLNGLDVDNRGRLLATNRFPSQAYLSLDRGLTWQAVGQLAALRTVTSGLTIGYGEAVHVPVERITRWGGRISEPETVGVDVVGAGEYLRLRLDDDGAVPSRYALSRLTMRYMMERNIR